MIALTNAKATQAKWSGLVTVALVTLGVVLGFGALMRLLVACAVNPISPQELVAVLQRDRVIAVHAALATFILVLGLNQQVRLGSRFIAAIIVAIAIWFLTWQFLHQAHFNHIRVRGGDPEAMLESLHSH